MKKLFAIIVLAFILSLSVAYTPMTHANYNNDLNYQDSPFYPQNPDYYNGNLRLQLKNRADIERASRPNLHYDRYTQETYDCNWKYNKGLDTWVCNKEYPDQKAESVKVCPVGYTLNSTETACLQNYPDVQFATNAPKEPAQQMEITRYVYFYDEESPTPSRLPSTGGGMGLILLGSLVGTTIFNRKK